MHRRGLVSNYQLLIIITVIRSAFASAWRPSVAQSMSAVVIASILFALLLAGFLRAYVNHEKQTKACQIAQNVRQFSCRLIWWHSRFGRQNGSGGLGRSNAGHVMNDCPSNAQMLDCQAEKVLRKAVAQKTEKEKKKIHKKEAPHRRLSGGRTKIKVASNKMLKGTYEYMHIVAEGQEPKNKVYRQTSICWTLALDLVSQRFFYHEGWLRSLLDMVWKTL